MFRHFLPNKESPTKKKRGRPAKNSTTSASDNPLSSLFHNSSNSGTANKKSKQNSCVDVYLLPSYYDDSSVGGRRMLHSKGCTRLRQRVEASESPQSSDAIPDLYSLDVNEGATDLFAV